MDIFVAYLLATQPDKQCPVCHLYINVLAVFQCGFNLIACNSAVCYMSHYGYMSH